VCVCVCVCLHKNDCPTILFLNNHLCCVSVICSYTTYCWTYTKLFSVSRYCCPLIFPSRQDGTRSYSITIFLPVTFNHVLSKLFLWTRMSYREMIIIPTYNDIIIFLLKSHFKNNVPFA